MRLEISRLKLDLLMDYEWKGNNRELRNFAEKLSLYPPSEVRNNFEYIFLNFISSDNSFSFITQSTKHHLKDSNITTFDAKVSKFEIELIETHLKLVSEMCMLPRGCLL